MNDQQIPGPLGDILTAAGNAMDEPEVKYGWTGRKIWKNATESVFRNLQSTAPEARGTHEPVGVTFRMDSLEDFRDMAIGHLGEHSNLALRTMERADWDEVYAFFKNYGQEAS